MKVRILVAAVLVVAVLLVKGYVFADNGQVEMSPEVAAMFEKLASELKATNEKLNNMEKLYNKLKEEVSKDRPVQRVVTQAVLTSTEVSSDNQFTVKASGVYFQPNVDVLDYAIIDADSDGVPEGSLERVNTGEDWGYRVEMSYIPQNLPYEFGVNFTKIDNSWQDFVSEPSGGNLFTTRLHANNNMEESVPTEATAAYLFDYQTCDLFVSYPLALTEGVSLDFKAGLRTTDIKQKLHIYYYSTGNQKDVWETNKMTGAGPFVGLSPSWDLPYGLSLKGGLGVALLNTDITYSFNDEYADLESVDNDQLTTVLDYKFGLEWQRALPFDFLVTLSSVYEVQNWVDAYSQVRFLDDVDPNLFAIDKSDLSLEGFVYGVSFTKSF